MIIFRFLFTWKGMLFEKNSSAQKRSESLSTKWTFYWQLVCGVFHTGLCPRRIQFFGCPVCFALCILQRGVVARACIQRPSLYQRGWFFTSLSGFVYFTGFLLRNVLSLCSVGSVIFRYCSHKVTGKFFSAAKPRNPGKPGGDSSSYK